MPALLLLTACGGGGGGDGGSGADNSCMVWQSGTYITLEKDDYVTDYPAAYLWGEVSHQASVGLLNVTTGGAGTLLSQRTVYGSGERGKVPRHDTWYAQIPLALGSNVLKVSAGPTCAVITVTRTLDTTPPVVQDPFPMNGSNGVAVDANPSVRFSEPMDPGTVDAASFVLFDSFNNVSVPGTVAYATTYGIPQATFYPASPFAKSVFTARITTAVRDLHGNNPLAHEFFWTFSTNLPPASAPDDPSRPGLPPGTAPP